MPMKRKLGPEAFKFVIYLSASLREENSKSKDKLATQILFLSIFIPFPGGD